MDSGHPIWIISLPSDTLLTYRQGWPAGKATVSEVLSEQFLKTKPIKPATKVGQHIPVEIGICWEEATDGVRILANCGMGIDQSVQVRSEPCPQGCFRYSAATGGNLTDWLTEVGWHLPIDTGIRRLVGPQILRHIKTHDKTRITGIIQG